MDLPLYIYECTVSNPHTDVTYTFTVHNNTTRIPGIYLSTRARKSIITHEGDERTHRHSYPHRNGRVRSSDPHDR